MRQLLFKVENLSLMRGNKQLLKNISFELNSVETLSLIGPKGAGKGLLVKSLLGIHSGEIQGTIQKMGQQRLGLVSDKYSCIEELTVFENLSLVSRMAGVDLQVHLAEEIEESLKTVGLWSEVKSQLHESVSQLSSFQKLRLNLCRALLFKPTILILDQPTQMFDPVQKAQFEAIMEQLKNSISLIWVNHDLEQVARVSDKVLFLEEGVQVECSSCEEFFTMPRQKSSEDYISRRFYV